MFSILSQLWDDTLSLIDKIPLLLYEGLAFLLFIGFIIFTCWKGYKKGIYYSAALLFLEYVFLIICSTVLYRKAVIIRKFDFHPFWSYSQEALFTEIIMNVLAFIPIGFLLGIFIKCISCWKVLLTGFLVSALIESLQFIFYKGFCEADDVIHNSVGCLIGYLLYLFLKASYKSIFKAEHYNKKKRVIVTTTND